MNRRLSQKILRIIKCFTWKLGHNNTCKTIASGKYEYNTTGAEPEKLTEKGRKICYCLPYPGDIPGEIDYIWAQENLR